MKNPDWNAAFDGSEQDWGAIMGSEVFRNYVKLSATKEQLELEEENRKKFKGDTDKIMKDVFKYEDESEVPVPLHRNFDYDGTSYSNKVERHNHGEKGEDFFDDFKNKHSKDKLPKAAFDKTAEEIINELIGNGEANDNADNDVNLDVDVEAVDVNTDVDIKELLETGAGESEYIDIGVTPETVKLMDKGIDYVDYPYYESPKEETNESSPEPWMIENLVEDNEEQIDEIKEAEKALGLDLNINYILSKMAAKGAQ